MGISTDFTDQPLFELLVMIAFPCLMIVVLVAFATALFGAVRNPQRQVEWLRKRQGVDALANVIDEATYLKDIRRKAFRGVVVCGIGIFGMAVIVAIVIWQWSEKQRETKATSVSENTLSTLLS